MHETKPITKAKALKPKTCPAAVRWGNELELEALNRSRFEPVAAARVLELLIGHLEKCRERLLKRGTEE